MNPSPFRLLHERTLILPNAWDAASAALIAAAGAPAIATTSAGVAWSLGFPDGERAPRDEVIRALRRIVAVSPVPVSADMEAGYGDIAGTTSAVIEAGAAGINLEDAEAGALIAPEVMTERVRLSRSVAEAAETDLFLNIRVDAFLLGAEDAFEATLQRAAAYVAAGADGIFVPGLADLEVVRALADAIPVPLNIMVGAGSPPVAELEAAGVRRISTGMALAQQAWGAAYDSAVGILSERRFDDIRPGVDYGRVNGLLARS